MPLPTTQNTSRPRSQGLHCRIDDTFYRLVSIPDKPMVETAELSPPRFDTSANPEDITPEFGTVFSLTNFSGGEGRDFAHRRNLTEKDTTRYWDSTGIDISRPDPGETSRITLTHQLPFFTDNTTDCVMVAVGGKLFVTGGPSTSTHLVSRFDTPLTSTNFTTEDPDNTSTNDTTDLAVLGDEIYGCLGTDGVKVRSSAGSWSAYSDADVDQIWAAKSRIIGAHEQSLYEVKTGATSDLLHTLDPSHTWTDVTSSGEFIWATATDGYVYSFTLNEDTGTLTIATRTHLCTCGPVSAIASVPGTNIVFYGTDGPTQRVYQAETSQEGVVVSAQLVRRYILTTDETAVGPILVRDDLVFWALPNGEVWRYDLVTGGRSRHLVAAGSPNSHTHAYASLLSISNLLFLGQSRGAGAAGDIFRESTDYVDSGHLITPLIDHFTATEKPWVGVNLDATPVGEGSVSLAYTTHPEALSDPDSSAWITFRVMHAGTIPDEPIPLNVESRYLAIKVTLHSGGVGTITPQVLSLSTRAYPGESDLILTLPINTSDQIEARGRRRSKIPNLGRLVYSRLQALKTESVTVELFDPPVTIQGIVISVSSQMLLPDSRGSQTIGTVVRVRGQEVTPATTPLGNLTGFLGSDHLLGTEPLLGEAIT